MRKDTLKFIDTESFSSRLRGRAISVDDKRVLIARIAGSAQEKDLAVSPNCHGYGRIRHFRLERYDDWSPNPLPIAPAAKALGYAADVMLRAQVFQNAACNWRCWYCFVPYVLLSANKEVSEYFTTDELIDMYLDIPSIERPQVIDLSGGQPDLVPEWIFWTMQSLEKRGLAGKIYLWSDDNLSNRYFWAYLSPEERQYMARFPNYSRVACFKGYDEASFAFNTLASPDQFEMQFEIYRDLLIEGFDMYAYVTLTSLPETDLRHKMQRFVDKLQLINPNLPLRTVPLKIEVFGPTEARVKEEHERSLQFQYDAHSAWLEELSKRFTMAERDIPICDVPL